MAELTQRARDIPAHVLLATDFTARCDRAQDRAVQLAIQWNASLTAIHALSDMALTDDLSVRDAYRNAALRNAKALREELALIEGLRSSVVVEEGPVDTVVLDAAARERADLIVTGIARAGPLAHVLVGSTVTALARKSPLPVLVVKKKVLETDERVVVATDMSASSRPAMMVSLTWFTLRRLALFHGFEPPKRGPVDDKLGYDHQYETAVHEQARHFLRDVAGEEAIGKFEIAARRGDPVNGLQVLASDADIDLVVTGTHGRTGPHHALVGSVAERILERVPSDILVVPSTTRG